MASEPAVEIIHWYGSPYPLPPRDPNEYSTSTRQACNEGICRLAKARIDAGQETIPRAESRTTHLLQLARSEPMTHGILKVPPMLLGVFPEGGWPPARGLMLPHLSSKLLIGHCPELFQTRAPHVLEVTAACNRRQLPRWVTPRSSQRRAASGPTISARLRSYPTRPHRAFRRRTRRYSSPIRPAIVCHKQYLYAWG